MKCLVVKLNFILVWKVLPLQQVSHVCIQTLHHTCCWCLFQSSGWLQFCESILRHKNHFLGMFHVYLKSNPPRALRTGVSNAPRKPPFWRRTLFFFWAPVFLSLRTRRCRLYFFNFFFSEGFRGILPLRTLRAHSHRQFISSLFAPWITPCRCLSLPRASTWR